MTDPPALAFANGICQSEAPAVAYATVYPLTMLLRIMVAQFLAVTLCWMRTAIAELKVMVVTMGLLECDIHGRDQKAEFNEGIELL